MCRCATQAPGAPWGEPAPWRSGKWRMDRRRGTTAYAHDSLVFADVCNSLTSTRSGAVTAAMRWGLGERRAAGGCAPHAAAGATRAARTTVAEAETGTLRAALERQARREG